jgi:hypothetical protein
VDPVDPVIVHLPASAQTYTGIISISLAYVANSAGVFRIRTGVQTATSPYESVGSVLPHAGRTVLQFARSTSATLVYEVTDVPADTDLRLFVAANMLVKPNLAHASFSTTNVVLEARFSTT